MVVFADADPPPPSPPPATNDPGNTISDPPPPYPSRERRTRTPRTGRRHVSRIQTDSEHTQTSFDSLSEYESPSSSVRPFGAYVADDDDVDATENTPFLGSSPRATRRVAGRPRSISHASVASVAPSFAQTILSLFNTNDTEEISLESEERLILSPGPQEDQVDESVEHARQRHGFFSKKSWSIYFRPVWHRAYYEALYHLLVLNFPYALAAWIYLFVFTLTGTTLLVALPIGAVLCFLNLLGARAFSRGELALQTKYHRPLAYPAPYPPRPIFTRYREPTTIEIETGLASPHHHVREKSFYKNSYAMFTDPTSYQALFYFLVVKPSITLSLSIAILVFVIPSLVLVLPAPAALRAVRRLGIWQANVAVEGLYFAVR
ncbi:hypothetical protein BDN72DRAFT_900388 [Pluteus cervinus]|uniref:Uncharacterized protein n=1 Tax=Pluteus cervinus TaxID=181527 RepID=A0ACD3AJH3_9AGAR|nr:hypothetical protein BDN72DRAFT_900388 [Pluteus cervinus]